MPARYFVFLQFEFPWALGPPDGRYLLRRDLDSEPERVVVLATLPPRDAGSRAGSSRGGLLSRLAGPQALESSPAPAAVSTSRVTVIDPVPLAAENQARAWLEGMDSEHEIGAALAIVSRVLYFQRVAAADPFVHEVSPSQALVARAGWGEGEQVADGRWLHARDLRTQPQSRRSLRSRRSRAAVLRTQERIAALMGARTKTLLCEELTLRARLDLDHDRLRLAALELDHALAAAVHELRAESRHDLAVRVAELEQLSPAIAAQARAATAAQADGADDAGATASAGGAGGSEGAREPDREVLTHALERLEAALRARTAPGLG